MYLDNTIILYILLKNNILGGNLVENIMDLVKVERHENYGLVVSSRVIARALDKRHEKVLRDIDKILINPNLGRLIFTSNYKDSRNRNYREYLLTKDGFILYMFNIQGHNKFKLAYINEFNRMERLLNQQRLLPMPKSDKVSIPLDKAVHWAKIKEIANKANEVRSDTYRKICKLSQDLAMITNQIDELSGMTFEVENLLDQIEN